MPKSKLNGGFNQNTEKRENLFSPNWKKNKVVF
jgi:hypothetical protein